MSEMVERAALKVRVKMMDSFGYEMSKDESITLVRTTIEAMRDPSRSVCEVAWKETRGTLLEEGYADAVDEVELHFNAVIDAVFGTDK